MRRNVGEFQARNWLCGHIKRDDPISRRLIEYLSNQRQGLLILVRDAESGKLIVKPSEEHRWLYRTKPAARGPSSEWKPFKSIGPEFFDEMEKMRSWKFSFKEYYDFYVWDLEPGEPFPALYNCVQEASQAATLIESSSEADKKDALQGATDTIHGFGDDPSIIPRNLFYGEDDRLEDKILFPEETTSATIDPLGGSKADTITNWLEEGISIKKFVEGWDSDYSDLDEDEVWTDEEDEEDQEMSDGSVEE